MLNFVFSNHVSGYTFWWWRICDESWRVQWFKSDHKWTMGPVRSNDKENQRLLIDKMIACIIYIHTCIWLNQRVPVCLDVFLKCISVDYGIAHVPGGIV